MDCVAIQNVFADEWKLQWITYIASSINRVHDATYAMENINLCVYVKNNKPNASAYLSDIMKYKFAKYLTSNSLRRTTWMHIYIIDEFAETFFGHITHLNHIQFQSNMFVVNRMGKHTDTISKNPIEHGYTNDMIIFIQHKVKNLLLLMIYEHYYTKPSNKCKKQNVCVLKSIDYILADNHIIRCVGKY